MSRSFSGLVVSVVIHLTILIAMAMMQINLFEDDSSLVVESVFTEEREQEEFSQELSEVTTAATSMNIVAGGAVSTTVGGASGAPAVSQTVIEEADTLKEPDVQVNAGEIAIPGEVGLGDDLGDSEVQGETGAVVPGYGAALSRISQELLRMMRTDKVLVVWLFDESESMKDDREEIRDKFHQIYDELGLAAKETSAPKTKSKSKSRSKRGRANDAPLLTSIISYGAGLKPLTPEPTDDIQLIKDAIDKIKIDESGEEQMCAAIGRSITEYSRRVLRSKRKLVIIVVSDESGDDGEKVEATIEVAKNVKAPIYVLGRESVFGYPYARVRWVDPEFKLTHWLRINRGPETAYPECLQWNGLHARWDVHNAGFGPYEMVRMAKETGGIFFVLPGEEENLSGIGANERRKFDFLAMKEYNPLLLSRRAYLKEREDSDFRKTIAAVIRRLDSNRKEKQYQELNIRLHHYSIKHTEFAKEAGSQFQRAAKTMGTLSTAIAMLEKIKPLRAREESSRWRAAYDLAYAQCLSYRVRLFQLMLLLDNHMVKKPQPSKPKARTKPHNEWNLRRAPRQIIPDDPQFARLQKAYGIKKSKGEYLGELKIVEDSAREAYQLVIQEHAQTPWARRAQQELTWGFGMAISSRYWNPEYKRVGKSIKIPKF
jgi:hypothetical protein